MNKKVFSLLMAMVLTLGLVFALGSEKAEAAKKPAKPTITVDFDEDDGDVKVTIDPTEDAEGYAIFLKEANDKSYKKIDTIAENGTKKRIYFIEGLKTGKYSIRVRAYNKISKKTYWSSFSKTKKVIVIDLDTIAREEKFNEMVSEKYPDLLPLIEDEKIGVNLEDDGKFYITFGEWNNAPLEWILLDYDEDNARALLISRYTLNSMKYNEKNENTTWEECTLRNWLNSTFVDTAFTTTQKKTLIVNADIYNEEINQNGISGGEDTKDRVFCLSSSEVLKYFKDKNAMIAYSIYDGNKNSWWLRSPGNSESRASVIWWNSNLVNHQVTGSSIYVRPAIYLNLETE